MSRDCTNWLEQTGRFARAMFHVALIACLWTLAGALTSAAMAAGPQVAGTGKTITPPTLPLPAAPAFGWCATSKSAATGYWQNVGECPPPPVTACPAGRYTAGRVAYKYNLTDYRQTDLTKADNIWGRNSGSGGQVGMPWLNYFAVFTHFPKTGYIAAEFTVPQGMPAAQWGMFSHGESLPGPNLTMAISERCGDFNPATALCLRSNIGPGGLLSRWKVPTATSVAACPVTPGRTYYINIKMTAPPATHNDCTGASCKVTVQHNHTP